MIATLLSICTALAGCGGGGGGSDEPAPNPGTSPSPGADPSPGTGGVPDGNAASWLQISPASISQTVKERSFIAPFKIIGKSNKAIDKAAYFAFIDVGGVFDTSTAFIERMNDSSYELNISILKSVKPGKYRGSLKVQVCNDDPKVCNKPYFKSHWTVPYDIEVKPWAEVRSEHKLLVSTTGVALTDMPRYSRLTRAVRISDNLGKASGWQAKSNESWLEVTPAGVAGDDLHIKADPTSLALNTMNYATITITSPDESIKSAESVIVAVWKSDGDLLQVVSSPARAVVYQNLLADPIKPLVYANGGGEGIDIVHVYTGKVVGGLSAPGSSLSKMLASPDGRYLYALDAAENKIKVFDLGTAQLINVWALDAATFDVSKYDMIYIRPNGVGLVVVTNGQVFRASDGKSLTSIFATAPAGMQIDTFADSDLKLSHLAASPDGGRIYATGSGQRTPFYLDLDYSEVNAGTLSFTRPVASSVSDGGGGGMLAAAGGIATSRDGEQLMTVSYGEDIALWEKDSLARVGTLTHGLTLAPETLVMANDGKMVVGSTDPRGMQYYIVGINGYVFSTFSTYIQPRSTGFKNPTYAWVPGLVISSDSGMVVQRGYTYDREIASWDGYPAGPEYRLTFTPMIGWQSND
ncbi:hypothetical protein HS961_11875 [Comamonas piscis]|uniref:BACON domain-containing protein n=1 Tax=Comamonas piscis TaxID=1562974 RepID=A0A7G5EHJ3_9BURK|nr:hypothetical protein [Comamonas piscis]QMV73468.1 hypothetical protein HS961_11875 [Comamonas piscis]WSO31883.1 hypothetical protein VUJ63_11910 [Comamonas piscis]